MKIVSIVSQMEWSASQKSRLQAIGEFIEYSTKKAKSEEVAKMISDAEILIVGSSGVDTINEYVFENCKNLKFITVLGVGADFVDLAAARKHSIVVSNLQGANSESVAEHIWGLILGLSKKIVESHIGTKAGKYEFVRYMGTELKGKTIGIIGFGDIGSKVARIAGGFDMRILSFSRTHKNIAGVRFVALEELMRESDVIAVTIPLTEQTTNLISDHEFSLMKPGVILVSSSREVIVNKHAVINALKNNILFGFGFELDINTPADDEFYKHNNVIVTPHNAFYTAESELKSNDLAVDNVEAFLAGKPQHVLN